MRVLYHILLHKNNIFDKILLLLCVVLSARHSLAEGLYIMTIDKFKEGIVFTDTNKSFYVVLISRKVLYDLKSVILSEMKSSGIKSIVEITPFS